jgi:ABC-2 type transport system permease protein
MTDVARFIYPTPSTLAFRTQMREEAKRNEELRNQREAAGPKTTDAERIARLGKSVERHGVQVNGRQPLTASSLSLAEGEEASIKLEDHYFTSLYDAYERQNRVYEAGGLFAPMLAVQSLSMGLASTDFRQHRHFAEAAEQYRRYLVQSLNWDLAVNDTPENRRPHPLSPSLMWYQPGNELWARFAPFEYTAPGTVWVLNNSRVSIATLLLWFLATTVLTVVAVARLRID